jgi:transcriptional regulator with XRE-family HTH domain
MHVEPNARFVRPREKFPQNLRLLRISRGFARARHFAEAIGIGENRYTRYERGEAEPNIDLIYKICDVLKAAPNDLFGIGEDRNMLRIDPSQRPGFADLPQAAPSLSTPHQDRQVAGWALARELAALEMGDSKGTAAERLKATAAIFLELERSPFHVIARILSGPAAATKPSEALKTVNDLVDAYLALLD